MSTVGFVGLVKDVATCKKFVSEVNGPRKSEYIESRKRLGLHKERVFLAETPMGAMILVYGEGINAGMQMARLRVSSNAFDKYQLEMLTKMSGMNLAEVPPGPPPHLVFEWSNGRAGKQATMIGAPVPDASKFWQMLREMSSRHGEHTESRERHRFTLERVHYLHEAKMVAVYLEGEDPAGAIERSIASSAAYDKWFIDNASAVHGIDFRAQKPPAAELLFAYDA